MPIVSASQTKIETPMSPPPSAVEIPSSGHSDPRTVKKTRTITSSKIITLEIIMIVFISVENLKITKAEATI